jgi:hypothetical protein
MNNTLDILAGKKPSHTLPKDGVIFMQGINMGPLYVISQDKDGNITDSNVGAKNGLLHLGMGVLRGEQDKKEMYTGFLKSVTPYY